MTDPQDVQSEEALLGAILTVPSVAKGIQLTAEDFYLERHGLIWDAAVKCANNGGCDSITVAAELERRNQQVRGHGVEGLDYLSYIAGGCPAPGNAKAYAKRVRETAELRGIRRSAQSVLEAIEKNDESAIAQALEALGHPIKYVDVASGELVEDHPKVKELEAVLEKKERRERTLLGQISQLEGKAEKKARAHKLWDEVEAVFQWYKLATGHLKITFTSEQFNQALPRWKEEAKGKANPCAGVLKAIAGIASSPSSQRLGGKLVTYDSWELLMRSQEKFIAFQDRAPGADDTNEWSGWLIRHIEGKFK